MSKAGWDDARAELLRRIDFKAFYTERGVTGWKKEDAKGNASAKCPLHEDKGPSLSVNVKTGEFKCFAGCPGADGGSVIDWVMIQEGLDFKGAFNALAKKYGVELPDVRPPIPANLPDDYHAALMRMPAKVKWFNDTRGLKPATLVTHRIGWDGQRFTIPVYDKDGVLRSIRRYKPKPAKNEAKFLPIIIEGHKYGDVRLFNERVLDDLPKGERVVLCEGELDCLVLSQAGVPAVTHTGGAGAFKEEWVARFRGLRVVIVYDNDKAGRDGAEKVAALMFGAGVDVSVARLPETVGDKGDVTDYFVALAGTAEEFKVDVLAQAKAWTAPPPDRPEGEEAIETTLPQSSDARHAGKAIFVDVMVSGKDTTPFIVPRKVTASCPVDGRKACEWCGMANHGGKAEVEFEPHERELIGMTMSSDTQIKGIINRKLKVAKCDAFRMQISEHQNLEDVRLIPEIDYFATNEVDEEYVSRQGMFVGQGLRANRSYRLLARPYSDPRTQYAMLLIESATPSQDSISSFDMNNQLAEELSVFKAAAPTAQAVANVFTDTYRDFASNVHHIFERGEMQTALDLIWHSVIGFDFDGRQVRKGWVEGLVLGDSGQGKTEMSLCLLHHYGLGERVQGEQVSIAGLVGGVEQNAKRWMLTWGKMPLNDRRLLIIEELSGMPVEHLGQLSDVRSTGVAEITKMRTERTNARCRLVFLSNTRTGRPVRQYDHGVRAVLELFGKTEDVRRLDFAIVVASGEVSPDVLNRARDVTIPHTYTRALCKRLILWAWSRRPGQVKFTDEAVAAIRQASRDVSSVYSSKIPLVEPADMRNKFARLAAAAAARTFSTPTGDHETLLVEPHHVAFVYEFLRTQYNKQTMGYDRFSTMADAGEKIDDMAKASIVASFKNLPKWQDLASALMESGRFRKGDIVDSVGYDREEARQVIPALKRMRAIRNTTNGFVKAPFFIELLKQIQDEAEDGGAEVAVAARPEEEF